VHFVTDIEFIVTK